VRLSKKSKPSVSEGGTKRMKWLQRFHRNKKLQESLKIIGNIGIGLHTYFHQKNLSKEYLKI
jgi:hypothetical protein